MTDKQRVNLFLDPQIVENAKVLGVKEKMSLSSMVDDALSDYIKKKKAAKVVVKEIDPLG